VRYSDSGFHFARSIGSLRVLHIFRPVTDTPGFRLASVLIKTASCTKSSGISIEDFSAYPDRQAPKLIERYEVPWVSMALIRNGLLFWLGADG
jgi:hypothetical protein